MKKTLVPVFLLVLVSFAFALGGGQVKTKPQTVTVTGKVIRVAAIGGETTGWALELESPLEIDGEELKRIEIDPGGKKIAGFEGKRIEITGILEKRRGVERGVYPVIVIEEIRWKKATGKESLSGFY